MPKTVVADSSFYICFLDDIKRPMYLIKVIQIFEFLIGALVNVEVRRSSNYLHIEQHIGKEIKLFEYTNLGELLTPFFSKPEIEKGEHEVIAISIVLSTFRSDLEIIIDDEGPRRFVTMNFPSIASKMTGTVGFVRNCYCGHNVFTREETLTILTLIKGSKFRVDRRIIDEAIESVKENQK